MRHYSAFRAIDLKTDESRPGLVTGRASVYGNVDSYGHMVMPGAFTKTLQENGHRIVVLSQHDPEQVIGTARLTDKADGLHFEARLLIDGVERAREDYARVKAGALTGISIGWERVRDEMDRKTGVLRLLEVKLWEISLVTFPANDQARVTGVKSSEQARALLETLRELKRIFGR